MHLKLTAIVVAAGLVLAACESPSEEGAALSSTGDATGSVEGPETLHFDAAEFAVPELGFIVENILIQDALLAALDSTNVSLNFATRIRSVQKSGDRYVVTYGDG